MVLKDLSAMETSSPANPNWFEQEELMIFLGISTDVKYEKIKIGFICIISSHYVSGS